MRSVPSTASPRRSSATPAARAAPRRARRSSSSRPASGPRPEPTLSASRSRNRSSSASRPTFTMNRRTAASDQRRHVAEHVVADQARRSGRARHAASASRPGARRPAPPRPSRGRGTGRRPSSPACRCRGAAPPAGSGRLARGAIDRPQRVIPEVLARDLVLRHAALRGELRRDRGEQARVGHQPEPDRRPLARPAACAARSRSARPTGGATSSAVAAIAGQRRRLDRRSRASPPVGRRGPSAARPRRSASPGRRRPGASGPRGRPGRRAGRRGRGAPPGSAPQAIALTVKSRRARSSSIESPNSTRCGRRKSA